MRIMVAEATIEVLGTPKPYPEQKAHAGGYNIRSMELQQCEQ